MLRLRSSFLRRVFPPTSRQFSSKLSENEQQIHDVLRAKFPNAKTLEVNDISGGCGAMYRVVVHTPEFKDLLTVQQHQSVTSALKKEIKSMHGITIETKSQLEMSDGIEEAMARASERQRYGSTSSEEEGEQVATSSAKEPERRFVDGRWLCLYENGTFCQFVDNEWKALPAETNVEELKQKWETVGPTSASASTRQVVNGVPMVWNPMAQAWLPDVAVDEDFMAQYQANYGVATDYDKIAAPEAKKPEVKLTKEEKRAKKRELAAAEAERLKGWIEMDESRNTKVYVSGLPTTITQEDFITFMTKCGVIMDDPRNGKPKVKLYKDKEGKMKGDGICCYIRVESVQLALDILDGMRYDADHTVHVERAKFEMKGNFDPAKKKARLTAAQKKKFLDKQQKLFEWKPEKPRNYRPLNECTVVLKNMFTLEEVNQNAAMIFDLKEEMKEMYGKFGILKSTVVYDTNPEGVITLTYENVEAADLAVKSLDGVIRHGRQISATLWDGKTKYKRAETEEEQRQRDKAWESFLGVNDEEAEEEDEPESAEN
ncbi:hypothetical protein M3Y94_00145900 [Aphelenchoides besseyi]|nr:hypothetical protein M3Y94_00145900 [Aphelenchoides besseyi]KAI6237199.1 hypothetical protein M3Y95_00240100 [Aphelenchoides besseyi]